MEVEEKHVVREVLEARRVVRHVVGVSWEEMREVAVAVEALVVAGVAAEAGGGSGARDRPSAHSGDGRGVVREVFQGGVPHVMVGAHDVDLG